MPCREVPSDPADVLPLPSTAAPGRGLPTRNTTDADVNRGTLIIVTATVCFFLLTFLGRVTTARVLPVEDWGEFNLGVSFTTLISVLILLGLNNAVARSLAYERDPTVRRAIIRWALLVSGVTSILGSVLTFLAAPYLAALFHDSALTEVFELLAITVGFGAATPTLAAIFQGFHNVAPNALFNQILNPALFLVAVVIFLRLGWNLNAALAAFVLANAGAFAGSVLYYLRRIDQYLPTAALSSVPRPEVKGLWRLSIALWGLGSLSFLTAYADTLILGGYRSALAVGYYSTAMSLARTLLLGGSALTFVFLPIAARVSRDGDLRVLRSSYVTASRWMLLISLPLFLVFVLLPGQSIAALFGARYAPADVPLQLLVTTAFVAALVGPANACLAGIGRNRVQLLTAGASASLNVVLSLLLIPAWGVIGAALAWGIARALYPTSNLTVLVRDYGVHPFHRTLVRPLLVSLAVTAPIFLVTGYLVRSHWIVFPLFFFALGVLLISLAVTDSLTPDDLVMVETLERLVRRRLPRLRAFMYRHLAPTRA